VNLTHFDTASMSTQAQTMLLAAGGGKSALQRLAGGGVGQGVSSNTPSAPLPAAPMGVYGVAAAKPAATIFGLDQTVAIGIGAALALAVGVVVVKKLRKKKK
jgi:hypothetical protein